MRYFTHIAFLVLIFGCERFEQKTDNDTTSNATPSLRPLIDSIPIASDEYQVKKGVVEIPSQPETVSPPEIIHRPLCRYAKVSADFDFNLSVDMDKNNHDNLLRAYIRVIDKTDKKVIQTITFEYEEGFWANSYDCVARSYTTGHNLEVEPMDGIYGDLVVADLNFDGKEDLAIFSNYGANVLYYRYYMQVENGHFRFNKFLTEKLVGFPGKIDTLNQKIETDNIIGNWGYALHTIKYDSNLKKFIEIRHQAFDGKTGKVETDWLKEAKLKNQ